jgi:RNA polymerase sigma-70 factor (ECF subfamily)
LLPFERSSKSRAVPVEAEDRLRFETTSWSLILQANEKAAPEARAAWERLCATYWPPIYAFIRRKGRSAEEAEDLTQAYFARFFEKDYLGDFRPDIGRFRTFLLASVTHFLANEWHKDQAQKRGGGKAPLSLDTADTEVRLRIEPVDTHTPEAIFERQWVATVLERSLEALRQEHVSPETRRRFERLKDFLSTERGALQYDDAARELGMTEPAVRVAVHRLRKRFGATLRAEVATTLADADAVDAELRWMLDVMRRPSR